MKRKELKIACFMNTIPVGKRILTVAVETQVRDHLKSLAQLTWFDVDSLTLQTMCKTYFFANIEHTLFVCPINVQNNSDTNLETI